MSSCRSARRPGRRRRALAEPADHGGVARDHRRGRDARRIPARDPRFPRPVARDHPDRAAAGPAAARSPASPCSPRSGRTASSGGCDRRRRRRARAPDRRGRSSPSPSSPRPSTCVRRQAAFEAVDREDWLEARARWGPDRGSDLPAIAIPRGTGRPGGGTGPCLGQGTGRVRRDPHVRGLVPAASRRRRRWRSSHRFATDFTAALALSAVLVAISAALLLTVKLLLANPRGCRRWSLTFRSNTTVSSSSCKSRSSLAMPALAGPSGCGKTTALRGIAGLVRPRGGAWLVARTSGWTSGEESTSCPTRWCGYVFQGLRAVRASARLAERRVTACGITPDQPPATGHGSRRSFRHRRSRPGPTVAVVGWRAPAGRTRPRACRRSARAAPGRAALGAGFAHAGRGEASAHQGHRCGQRAHHLGHHDFQEAALFGDEVAILDAGRAIQRGQAAELAAAPANSFVADFSGAVVLVGSARPEPDGGTVVALDGGGEIASTARATGRVAASVYPWEISLDLPGVEAHGSIRDLRLPATVGSITALGRTGAGRAGGTTTAHRRGHGGITSRAGHGERIGRHRELEGPPRPGSHRSRRAPSTREHRPERCPATVAG